MPYRSTRFEAPKATPEAGIVDDMVRQFADPYAFLRELVQNGIDAGAKTLTVRIERDGVPGGSDGGVRTSVEDDGKGMTRAIIDGPLLTLFESSKESDETKIGKYGVGFVSVFALDPTRVEVRTRTAGEAWLLRLFRDYTFELEPDEAPPEGVDARGASSPPSTKGTGTIVTLVHTVADLADHATRAEQALERWCRHARIPISLSVMDATAPADATPRSINEPFGIDADVAVRLEQDGFTIFAGVSAPNASFAGFYNRGLTLYETTEPERELAGVRFKIDSPRLAHTLSRDNVRRDAELERALELTRKLVRGPLWAEIEARVREAAAASDPARLAVLYGAASAHAFRQPDLRALFAPLTDPIDSATALTLARIGGKSDGRILVADEPSVLTRALARRGHPVVRHLALATVLGNGRAGFGVRLVNEAFSFAAADDVADTDEPLFEALRKLLAIVRRPVERVRHATFLGANDGELFRAVDSSTDEAVTKPGAPPDWGRSSTLFLNRNDALVRIARRRAKADARIAAHVLCRAILLQEGPIAPKDVDRLLEASR
jgi:molecular chaperone HtpG